MDPNQQSGNDSPPLRTTILGSFLRGRPRNSSQSHIVVNVDTALREVSPSPPTQPPSPIPNNSSSRRRPAASPSTAVQPSTSHQPSTNPGLGISHMLRRRRSAGNVAASPVTPAAAAMPAPSTSAPPIPPPIPPQLPGGNRPPPPGTHRIRLVPHLDSRRSLRFDAIGRDLKDGDPPLRIGRFTDRSGLGLAAVNALGSNKLAFKSKVVSRAHAEIWCESSGRFFIKDTKSSSGTFLNHVRLSPANTESRPHQIKDGDILQLGVDYQGGAEDIYKSVKIRIEVGREWQAAANAFNTNALKNLKTLAVSTPGKQAAGATLKPAGKSTIPDCCICLFGVNIRQALFIAPCSHTFHYKCIRPLLESHFPAFSCPLCRTFADLEEDVEVEGEGYDDEDSAIEDAPGNEATASRPATAKGDRERDRDAAGAETEVEADGVNGTRPRRSRTDEPRVPLLVDLTSDNSDARGEDFDMAENVGSSRRGAPGEDSDGDVLVEDAGMVDAIVAGGQSELGEGDDGLDGTVGGVGGKRKR